MTKAEILFALETLKDSVNDAGKITLETLKASVLLLEEKVEELEARKAVEVVLEGGDGKREQRRAKTKRQGR